jgi:natural product precursor
MKPKKTKKLTLKKVTITNLNNSDMRLLYGGGTVFPTCPGPTLPTNCLTKCVTNCPECPAPGLHKCM